MSISEDRLEQLLKEAAERGAEECLHKMGIQADNIHEIRNMLDVFKAVRRGVLNAITKLIMLLVVGVVLGAAAYFGIDWK